MTQSNHTTPDKVPLPVNFVDWMKASGMFIIVFGHVFGPPFDQLTQPIKPKQLGVAFFIFIIGWSLANDHRPKWQVIFNRLFPVYLFGITIALLLSLAKYITQGDLAESNYLPFMLGINVILNYFPANPTTWYIGTYIHFIIIGTLWAGHLKIKRWMLGAGLLVEILIRFAVLSSGKYMVAYMIFPNWLTIFLLGIYFKGKKDEENRRTLPFWMLSLLVLLIAWPSFFNHFSLDNSFPFKNFTTLLPANNLLILSTCISAAYLLYTMLAFEILRRVPANNLIRFFSRNTLIIFIVHMPILYLMAEYYYPLIDNFWLKKGSTVLILYVGIALLSELINNIIKPKLLRNQLWQKLTNI